MGQLRLQLQVAFLFYNYFLGCSAFAVKGATIRRSVNHGSLIANGSLRISSLLLASAESGDRECDASPETSQTPSASPLSRKPKSGDIVTFTLLRFQPTSSSGGDDDDHPLVLEPLFDTTGTLQLVLNGGNYLPGLHVLLSTMKPGERIEGATIDAGYGGFQSDLVFQISTSEIGDAMDTSAVQVGTVLRMGNGMECRVTDMKDEQWTLDANHLLAGAAYEVDVKLETVEEGITNWEYVGEGGDEHKYKVATVALGCFWGGELAYQRLPGVVSTHVGYTQGHRKDPTYEEVCAGTTGHTEAIRIVYDPHVVSFSSLVQLGMERLGGDVYKLDQVGNDRGTQYRHGIYFHDDLQREVAQELLKGYGSGVMTEVKPASVFYRAEEYHQQYLLKGGQSAKKGSSSHIQCYG